MKKLWILNHHSGLEGDRHFELAREFVSQGVEVVVFMSSYSHRGEKYLYEKEAVVRKIQDGLTYVWLHTDTALSWKWCSADSEYDFLLSADEEV